MDAKVLAKLAHAEEDFVSAMLAGSEELVAYESAWASLLDEISQAYVLGDIHSSTLAIADEVVARVATLVECCLSSAPSPSSPVLSPDPSSPSPRTISFIPEAYSWLLKNIANPYPPPDFKASLAQRHNSSVSTIGTWFANVRRRMGWTALCRNLFRNCRADTVDAAYHVLVEGDSNCRLGAEVTHAFIAMKVVAEELYASHTKSALAGELDAIIKDPLTEDKTSALNGGHSETRGTEYPQSQLGEQSECASDIPSQRNLMPQICYPFPDSSHSSPLPSLNNSPTSKDQESLLSASLPGRKRRLSSSEWAYIASSELGNRSLKRPRFSTSSHNDRELHSILSDDSFGNITNSHKRRLSNPHATGVPTCSRTSVTDPRLDIASAPLSSGCPVDEWLITDFDSLFAVPPPVNVVEPDLSTRWEVELFNNYSIPENPQLMTSPTQEHQTLSYADLSTFEDLLRSLGSNGSVSSPETTCLPTTMSFSDAIPQDVPLLQDISTIDWTTFLHEGFLDHADDPVFPQPSVNSAVSEMDLSLLQLPQVLTTSPS